MTDGTLFTGKSVEDAVADGLRSLGLTQEQAEIEVISRGSRGLFGIGSEPAQVRITPRASKAPAQGAATPPARETPASHLTASTGCGARHRPATGTVAAAEPPASREEPAEEPDTGTHR